MPYAQKNPQFSPHLQDGIKWVREAYLAAIVDSSDDAIISKTLDGLITSWNAAAVRIFGYTADEMIGQSLLKLIPTERWSEEYHIQDELRKGNKIDHYETKRIAKDGRVLDVSLTISPIRDKDGCIVGASKVARDITRQKRDEGSLRESEERLRLAVETASLGTWALALQTSRLGFSKKVRDVLLLPPEVPSEVPIEKAINLVYPDDRDLVREKLAYALDPVSGGSYEVEHRVHIWNSPETRWVRIRGKMYFDTYGRPEKLIGTLLDITDEKMTKERLERMVEARTEDLQKANELLRQSNHNLEQFAYIASHDLQEPLRKIQSFIDMMRYRDDKEMMAILFDKINQSAHRMSVLINDVLNYARLSKDGVALDNVNLNDVLTDVLVDYENRITEKGAVISGSDLPMVQGVYPQLKQLFANLVGNSLKFSSGSPRIEIRSRVLTGKETGFPAVAESATTYIALYFSDNGIGFEQKYADQIFMIFQRLHTRSEYSGTGIGLALCQKIVENHQGYIKAEGEPGKGAVFTVLLPATQ